jgi:hypothetical protein
MREQAQPIGPLTRIIAVDGDLVEEFITAAQPRQRRHGAGEILTRAMAARPRARLIHGLDQALLLRQMQQADRAAS